MVKKAKWLKNVKKAFSPDKLKHQSVEESVISYPVLVATSRSSPPQFEVRVDQVNYEHKKKNNLSPPPSEEEEDVLVDSTPSSPDEFVPPSATPDRFAGKSKEDAAAIFIQSTFRGHLARQESRRMRRLARLKSLMEGSVVQRQAANTLKSMQTLTRVQSQVQSRRIRMSEENQTRHKQLLKKHAKEIGGLKKNGSNWIISNQSKEQVEAGLLNKYEAMMRRERALAYAFTHQQHMKSNLKPTNTMFMDPNNLTWGWSWLERWMADKPWESSEKEQSNTVKPAVKTSTNRNSHGGETTKTSNRKKLNSSSQPNTPSTSSSTTRNPRNNKPIRPKSTDEIPKNSEKNRRHSIARSSVSDDEGMASSTARRRNMVPTTKPVDEIAKSSKKNRMQIIAARSSVSDDEGLASSTARRCNMVPRKPARSKLKGQSSSGVAAVTTATTEEVPAKKRASPAPKPRRSSAPAKVENNVVKAVRTSCD